MAVVAMEAVAMEVVEQEGEMVAVATVVVAMAVEVMEAVATVVAAAVAARVAVARVAEAKEVEMVAAVKVAAATAEAATAAVAMVAAAKEEAMVVAARAVARADTCSVARSQYSRCHTHTALPHQQRLSTTPLHHPGMRHLPPHWCMCRRTTWVAAARMAARSVAAMAVGTAAA